MPEKLKIKIATLCCRDLQVLNQCLWGMMVSPGKSIDLEVWWWFWWVSGGSQDETHHWGTWISSWDAEGVKEIFSEEEDEIPKETISFCWN